MSARSLTRASALALVLLAALLGAATPAPAAELPADDSFGAGGHVFAPLGDGLRPNDGLATVEAPDGDIVSAGTTSGSGWYERSQGPEQTPPGLVVLRFDPWGAPDTTFGESGLVRVGGLDGEVSDLRALADGSVLVLVEGWSDVWLVKLSPAGAASQRKLVAPVIGKSECMFPGTTLADDGKAVIVWYCGGETIAQSAGLTGDVTTSTLSAAPAEMVAQDVVVDTAGRLIVAYTDFDDTTIVGRYSATGTHDTGYGTEGWATLAKDFQSILRDAQGRIVVGTYSCCWGAWSFSRLDGDGILDDAFGAGGVASVDDERLGLSGPEHLRTAPGGALLATGLLGTGSGNGTVVLRLLGDGTPDESFGPGGIMDFDPARTPFGRGAAAAQADGNVLVTLGFAPDPKGARTARAEVPDSGTDRAELLVMRFGTARRQRPATTDEQGSPPPPQQQTSSVQVVAPSSRSRVARTCLSRRSFTIRLRPKSLRSAVVRVAGKRVRVRRRGGRLTAKVDLRKLRQATFKVSVVARDRRGRTHRETRSYRTCRVGEHGRKVKAGSTLITVG